MSEEIIPRLPPSAQARPNLPDRAKHHHQNARRGSASAKELARVFQIDTAANRIRVAPGCVP